MPAAVATPVIHHRPELDEHHDAYSGRSTLTGDGRQAGTRFTYPKPSQLPSADQEVASAGAAASLAHADHTTRQLDKAAAEHPVAGPQLSALGSKAAYLAGSTGTLKGLKGPEDIPTPRGAKIAATGALSRGRKRAESAPPVNSAYYGSPHAVTAATISHRAATGPEIVPEESVPVFNIRKIHDVAVANARRELYPEEAVLGAQADERAKKEMLHATAVTMARQTFAVMPQAEANVSDLVRGVPGPAPFTDASMLHDVAQRQASEKLANMHDEHKAFKDYYTAGIPPKRQSSIYAKLRNRASSEGDTANMDQEHSMMIRSQMSAFQNKMAAVNAQRARDHQALMEAATRKAGMTIDKVDNDIYEATGRPPSMVLDKFVTRPLSPDGGEGEIGSRSYVPIGGGKFVNQDTIEDLARKRTRPTMDEVLQKAQEAHAQDIEEKLDEIRSAEEADIERERAKEASEIQRQIQGMEEKTKFNLLNRLSKESGGLFRLKSKKSRGKQRAKEVDVPASGAIADTSHEEEYYDLTGVPERQNSPPKSYTPPTAGESHKTPLMDALKKRQSASSDQSQSSGSDNSHPRPKDHRAKTDGNRQIDERRTTNVNGVNGSTQGADEELGRRRSEPAATTSTTRPRVQQSSSTEAPREQPQHRGILSRQSSKRTRPSLRERFFGKSSQDSPPSRGPFEVKKEQDIVQTTTPATAPPVAVAAAPVSSSPEPVAVSSGALPATTLEESPAGSQSKFTEQL
ncbi:hypothetical protein FQN53_003849 [Emmonsiellopsis sp. PD_33]|nr:hypothetical protein FQN53_003849 [Emmonsiellopsis sp. PD_33]